jgi:hypothetical protein
LAIFTAQAGSDPVIDRYKPRLLAFRECISRFVNGVTRQFAKQNSRFAHLAWFGCSRRLILRLPAGKAGSDAKQKTKKDAPQ